MRIFQQTVKDEAETVGPAERTGPEGPEVEVAVTLPLAEGVADGPATPDGTGSGAK